MPPGRTHQFPFFGIVIGNIYSRRIDINKRSNVGLSVLRKALFADEVCDSLRTKPQGILKRLMTGNVHRDFESKFLSSVVGQDVCEP